jgi:hypothetical protein
MRNVILAAVTLGLLSACIGPAALPKATEEKVTPADIVGTWRYPAEFGATTITLELKPDGTFVQTVRHGSGRVQTHQGTWVLEGSHPRLEVLKPVFGEPPGKEWVVESAHWWIVESQREGVKFAIFGAADDRDPDSCWEFEKVR